MSITPYLKEIQVLQAGGEVFTPPATWIDVLQSTATASSFNVTTMRANAGYTGPLYVIFAADGPFWANFNGGTAAVPTGNTTNGTGSEFSPNQKYIDATVAAISIVSASNVNVSMQFYRP